MAQLRLLNALLPVSSVFSPLFPVSKVLFINICLYTVPTSGFSSPVCPYRQK